MFALIIALQFMPAEYIQPVDTLTLYDQHASGHKFVVFTDSIQYQDEIVFRIKKISGLAGEVVGDTIKLFIKQDDRIFHARKTINDTRWSKHLIIKQRNE